MGETREWFMKPTLYYWMISHNTEEIGKTKSFQIFDRERSDIIEEREYLMENSKFNKKTLTITLVKIEESVLTKKD